MKVQSLPKVIDVKRLSERKAHLQGAVSLAAMTRLAELLATASTNLAKYDVELTLDFGILKALHYLQGSLVAQLPLTCQRCLEAFDWSLEHGFRLGVVATEADIASLPADYEPLLLTGAKLELVELIEDELLLQLPLIPMHQHCQMAWQAAAEQVSTPANDRFAGLKNLSFDD